jgi:membrane-associated phospholipid phosphatase
MALMRVSGLPRWVIPLAVMVGGFFVVHPFDGPLSNAAARLAVSLKGDIARELFAWQQYGQGLAILVAVLIVWVQDPARRRRLLDLGLALLIAQVVSTGGKMLIGRPRPREEFNDPNTFLTPWGEYPIVVHGKTTLVHAWDTGAGASTDLWSMPSSHTLFAAVLSVFLATLYPRLRWVMLGLTLLVGLGRVLFDAHWPTDVVVGGAAGWMIGRCLVPSYTGVRALDWMWVRIVNRRAKPAFPGLLAAESTRASGR